VLQKHNGKLPDSFSDLKNLPGIGDYTASAILSIAKDQSFIGIDGNVKRVISRVFNLKHNKKLLLSIEKKLNSMKVKKGSSELMQGIMELGALLCLPIRPGCTKCPIKSHCISFKKNTFKDRAKKKSYQIKYLMLFLLPKTIKFYFIQ